jgi:hypothetical protein
MMDPVSGYWAKNEDEGEESADPTVNSRQRIVPAVQDRKNALLLQPAEAELSQSTLTTVQHALLRGIESVFQLEEGEILAEPMPTRDERKGFLFYEATEGGAGVLTRLAAESGRLAQVAREALAVMHFDLSKGLPEDEAGLVDEPGTGCVAACYRCVMSYYNQPDHELLDRRDESARSLLLRLANAQLGPFDAPAPRRTPSSTSQVVHHGDATTTAWLKFTQSWGLPVPDADPLVLDGKEFKFVWRSHYVAAVLDGADATFAQLEHKGFDVVLFGPDESTWSESTRRLATLLGR